MLTVNISDHKAAERAQEPGNFMLVNDCEPSGLGIKAFIQVREMVSTKVNCQVDRPELQRFQSRRNMKVRTGCNLEFCLRK